MTGDEALLAGLQLADSFLPVGTYSSSYALEQFVADERVADGDDLVPLLESYLERQVGPCELVALRAAHAGAAAGEVDAVLTADQRLHATTLPAEFRESATRAGKQLRDLWRRTRDETPLLDDYAARDPPSQYPAVLGAVAATADLDARRACLVHGYGFCSAMLAAAQRLCSLGHTRAQTCLEVLKPAIVAAVDTSAGRDLSEMTTFAPEIEIRAAAHERATRRLFVS